MSERLKRFRKLMSAFEGTSNPQRAIEQGYYVDLPNSPMKDIVRRIEVRPVSMYLLLGGIGSGKTTQLLLTQNHLNQLENFNAIYVDVSLRADIANLKPGVLTLTAGVEILKMLDNKNQGNLVLPHVRQSIYDMAYGSKESINSSALDAITQLEKKVKLEFDQSLAFGQKGSNKDLDDSTDKFKLPQRLSKKLVEIDDLKRSVNENNTSYRKGLLSTHKQEENGKILELFVEVSEKAIKKNGEILLILDGLDRIADNNIFVDCILNDVMQIVSSGIGVILVGSIPIVYNPKIEQFSSHLHYFSYPNPINNEEDKKFFVDVLAIRDPDNLLSNDTKELLIAQSGGVLRDLMSLTQSAIEEAYVDGSDDVQLQHAEEAVATLARAKFIGLTDANLKKLKYLKWKTDFLPRTSEEFDLLLKGAILEYRVPKRDFVVHPVLTPLIEEL